MTIDFNDESETHDEVDVHPALTWYRIALNAVFRRRIEIGLTMLALGIDFLAGFVWSTQNPTWPNIFCLGVLTGLVCVQVNLLGLWGGMGPDSWLVRVPWTLLMVILATSFTTLGQGNSAETVDLLASFAIASVGIQIPFLVVAKVWKVRFAPSDRLIAKSKQYNIANLLLSTSLIAVAIAIMRMILPRFTWGDLLTVEPLNLFLVLILFLVNLLTCVPVLYFLLANELTRFQTAVLGAVLGPTIVAVTCIQFGSIVAVLGDPPDSVKLFVGFLCLNTAQYLGLTLTILFLKHSGYGLQSTRVKIEPTVREGTAMGDFDS